MKSEYDALPTFLLYENGVIGVDEVIKKGTLPKVQMPNRNGFVNAYPDVPEKYKAKD